MGTKKEKASDNRENSDLESRNRLGTGREPEEEMDDMHGRRALRMTANREETWERREARTSKIKGIMREGGNA